MNGEDARQLIIDCLKSSKGWMTGYAEAFVDDLLQHPITISGLVMNRDEAKNILANADVIEAFIKGKQIQYRGSVSDPWKTGDSLSFRKDPSLYRVKPERQRVNIRVYVVVRYDDGKTFIRNSLKAATAFRNKQRELGFDADVHSLTKEV